MKEEHDKSIVLITICGVLMVLMVFSDREGLRTVFEVCLFVSVVIFIIYEVKSRIRFAEEQREQEEKAKKALQEAEEELRRKQEVEAERKRREEELRKQKEKRLLQEAERRKQEVEARIKKEQKRLKAEAERKRRKAKMERKRQEIEAKRREQWDSFMRKRQEEERVKREEKIRLLTAAGVPNTKIAIRNDIWKVNMFDWNTLKDYRDQIDILDNADDKIQFDNRATYNAYNIDKYISKDETKLLNMLKTKKAKRACKQELKSIFDMRNELFTVHYPNTPKEWVLEQVNKLNETTFIIILDYISPSGRAFDRRCINISYDEVIEKLAFIMSKKKLNNLKTYYHDKIANIVSNASTLRNNVVITEDVTKLEILLDFLYSSADRDINRIKDADSYKWEIISNNINEIQQIVDRNQQLLNYYNSNEFKKIKNTYQELTSSLRDFNAYIDDKVSSISNMFGKREIRTKTVSADINNYQRPYQKVIDAFTTELSASVFANAENNPLDYVIKCFYPIKSAYPEQIQQLQVLISELATLQEAKEIIEKYKQEYQEYLVNVPNYVMTYDKDGFYSRLGFANLCENKLVVVYKFMYTSDGGYAQRSFTVPMTEEIITKLITALQNKLSYTEFAKQQRSLMTEKLRQQIKERDNYTCRCCGNSTYNEPNLLLEIDHIKPIKHGGITEESNLQILCWRCNRSKGARLN